MLRVGVIGGGAAGFFAAINLFEMVADVDVTILEASDKVLSKVRVSGGGRCNLTNTFESVESLSKVYPRGEKIMRRALREFGWRESYDWFEEHGVPLMVQEDDCVFPEAQSSEAIINMFADYSARFGVKILTSKRVAKISKPQDEFVVETTKGEEFNFDVVVVTTGGAPTRSSYSFMDSLPVSIKEPTPSLYTLNISEGGLTDLMGVVIPDAIVGIASTKFRGEGALLITHWGVSGPATLKLSSYAAEYLKSVDYRASLFINWVGVTNEDEVMSELNSIAGSEAKKQLSTARPYALSSRVWQYLLSRGGVDSTRRWGDVSRKSLNTMVRILTNDIYHCCGKAKHKEEFVTCGGVDLSKINPHTLSATECEGLFFAGEVLDIDAITGGFNLQAAWSTAHKVATSISKI
ncbi:MAG: aminoacetone oxidase family FAD-binding enzyme [Rikenellaceae bacterium]